MTSTPSQTDASRTVAQYAGFRRRVAAELIDMAVVGLVVFAPIDVLTLMGVFVPGAALLAAAYLVFLVLAWVYGAMMESSHRQATLGKMALGLMVRDVLGNRLTREKALIRNGVKSVAIGTFGSVYCMLPIIVSFKKQAAYDIWTDSIVITRPERAHPDVT